MAGSGRCCVAAMSNHADARLPAFGRRREVPGYCGQSRQNEKAPLARSPFSVSRARPERWRPRSATGRPAGAVADALRCGESATSNLAGARLSTSRRRRASLTSHRRSGEMKTGVPFGTPVLISLARPERFELPTFWFVARHSIQLSYGRVVRRNSTGGERGIRTLEGLLTLTPLAGARLRPLGHLSLMQRAAKDSDPAAPRKAASPESHWS